VPFIFLLYISIDYFAPENICKFATYLYEQKDYIRAANEFERYLFSFDSLPENADSLYYKIGFSYKLGGDIPQAIAYFQRSSFKKSPLQIAICYALIENYDKSNALAEFEISKNSETTPLLSYYKLMAFNYIQKKEWSKAVNSLTNCPDDSLADLLGCFAEEGRHFLRKSSFLSGLFSSVIPGVGKVYCGHTWDGFFSLLTIGLTGWQSYVGFSSKDGIHSVRGWAFGLAGSMLYLGNIYGSIVSARIYNEEKETALLNKVNMTINIQFW